MSSTKDTGSIAQGANDAIAASQTESHETEALQCTAHVGIDVSKAKLDVALLRMGKVRSKVIANSASGFAELVKWLLAQGVELARTHVCMEATGPYSEAPATALADAGLVVSVVNPVRVKGFGQSELIRNKTDEVDAALIARFCAAMHPEAWKPPAPEQRKLRSLVDRLSALQSSLQQEKNRQKLPEEMADPRVLQSIEEHVLYLEQAIAKLQQDVDDHIDGHPQLKARAALLTSIDGIGDVTTAKVLAYGGDVTRFDSAKAFSAFVGVAPRQKRSGTSIKGRTMMGKGGSNALRHALFMPAMVAVRHNALIKDLAERLKAKGLKGKAIIGAAMHKLAHLIYGVLKTQQPYRADWAKGLENSKNEEVQANAHAPA